MSAVAQPFETTITIVVSMVAMGLFIGVVLYFMVAGFLYWRDIEREKQADEQRRRR